MFFPSIEPWIRPTFFNSDKCLDIVGCANGISFTISLQTQEGILAKNSIIVNLAGCLKRKFDYSHWFLKMISFLTSYTDLFRYGDQSLFITREIFERINGFNSKLIVMEDPEIVKRIKKHTNFSLIDSYVITSARKFRKNGVYRLFFIFFLVLMMYHLGFSQQKIIKIYTRFIR